MDEIFVEHNPSPIKLDTMNVDVWPVWKKEVSEFDWQYDQKETCYILEGEAVITPESGEPVTIKAKDLVYFPKGMRCQWKITIPIEKHYLLED